MFSLTGHVKRPVPILILEPLEHKVYLTDWNNLKIKNLIQLEGVPLSHYCPLHQSTVAEDFSQQTDSSPFSLPRVHPVFCTVLQHDHTAMHSSLFFLCISHCLPFICSLSHTHTCTITQKHDHDDISSAFLHDVLFQCGWHPKQKDVQSGHK